MIITDEKPWNEIKATLDSWNVKKILVTSCGICAAKVGTGGEEGAKKMIEKLIKEGYQVIGNVLIDEPCDNRLANQAVKKSKDLIEQADAVLNLSCGLGTQSLGISIYEKMNKPILTALNTVFMGETERIGNYHEGCRACGDCLLNETGGICPITACAKSMLNGPCGGSVEGKCEVGNYTKPCGWILIYDRLKSINRLDLFFKLRPARNWSFTGAQRDMIVGKEGIIPGNSVIQPYSFVPTEGNDYNEDSSKKGEKSND